MSTPPAPPDSVKIHPWFQTGINYLIIGLMMVCITAVMLQVPQRVFPEWKGDYLLVLSFLIALEALFSRRIAENLSEFSLEWILHRTTEWVVILVVVKGLMYVLNDPSRLLVDLPLWQKDFLNNFFTADYSTICVYLLFIWLSAGMFGGYLEKLEADLDLLELEREGNARTDRGSSRQSLMTLLFVIGAVLLFITGLVHIDLPFFNTPFEYRPSSAIFLMLYFLLGFVLLAQSQYSILRARWYLQGIPMSAEITRRWAPFSIIMLVVTMLIAFLLPTRYSRGFLTVLQTLVAVIINAIYTVMAVILAFFTSLMARLFGGPPTQAPPEAPPVAASPELPRLTYVPTHPAGWIDLLQNILFWAIFVAIIFFAFRYYLAQRQGVISMLKRWPIWFFLKQAWTWLRSRFLSVNRLVSSMVESGTARLRALVRKSGEGFDPLMTISRRLPPRQRILLVYLAMVRWNNQNGIYRKGSETPNEYARSLRRVLPDAEQEITLLTNSFMEARYTRHDITRDQAELMQVAWEHFQENLRNYLELQKQSLNQA